MGNIVLLDDLTINQIAAGEVIERPMNVVKELVENSIDAGATKVVVTIKDGGKTLIQVTDNGSGIDLNNMDIALERHATSKISKIEDLENTYSFGFRGEALASISSISELTMISKTADEMVGYKLFSRGGNILEKDEIGAQTGTTIKVEKLFYNTPVRYKFLKNDATEFRYIKEFLQKVALAEPDKSIELINNGKQILKTSGNGEIKDVVYLLYGKEIKDNLVDVNYQDGDIKITGVVGNTFIAEENRKNQILFLNNRNIQDKILTNSADQAFKGSTGIGKYGFFILNLQMPADYYDVNVHPTKMELRFSNNEYIYNFVYDTCLKALNSKELIAEVSVPDPVAVKIQEAPVVRNVMPDIKLPEKNILDSMPCKTETKSTESSKAEIKPKRLPEPFEIKGSLQMVKEDKVRYEAVTKSEPPKQMNLFENKLLDESSRNKYRIIGQLFDTYWLIEFEDKFYMMDQHAAHEKVLYERTMNKLHNKTIETQMILPPIVLSLNMHEEEIYKANQDVFKRLGYEIEEFGGNEYKVTGIPAGLPKMDYKQLLIDVLDGLSEESAGKDPDIITEKVASMSCKAAVKGNNRLSFNEAFELMDELMKAENPYNCPHGRPTLIMMSRYEIEKKFKRIV